MLLLRSPGRGGGSAPTSSTPAGVPRIAMCQDPIESFRHTWPTNLDTCARAVPEDLQASAVVIAATAWFLANRDELLPRFSPEQMPPLPGDDGS